MLYQKYKKEKKKKKKKKNVHLLKINKEIMATTIFAHVSIIDPGKKGSMLRYLL